MNDTDNYDNTYVPPPPSAYTMWANQWRANNPQKKNPPAGLWNQLCNADPRFKISYQELANRADIGSERWQLEQHLKTKTRLLNLI